jgi:hypothetical protein
MAIRRFASAMMLTGIAGIMSLMVGTGVASAAATAATRGSLERTAIFSHMQASPKTSSVPRSSITDSSGTLSFDPSIMDIGWSGPTAEPCSATVAAMNIKNTTTTSQTVVFGGTDLPIAAGHGVDVCFWGTGKATVRFHLQSHDKVKLKVVIS